MLKTARWSLPLHHLPHLPHLQRLAGTFGHSEDFQLQYRVLAAILLQILKVSASTRSTQLDLKTTDM